MDEAAAAAYLDRIGIARPAAPTSGALRELTARHLAAVPFENLSIHLGEPIDLAETALLDKLVGRRRGGFCYELNGAFALLLEHLGYAVTRLAARVSTPAGWTPPFAHLTLRVDLEEPWLVDVGFGRFVAAPVRLDLRTPQPDPGGDVEIQQDPSGDLVVHQGGEPQIRVEPQPRTLADFGPTCWWTEHSPDSHFTHGPTCSLPTSEGRVTLAGRTLIETTAEARTEHQLGDDAAVLAAYRQHFGIVLDRVPEVPERMSRG